MQLVEGKPEGVWIHLDQVLENTVNEGKGGVWAYGDATNLKKCQSSKPTSREFYFNATQLRSSPDSDTFSSGCQNRLLLNPGNFQEDSAKNQRSAHNALHLNNL